MIHLDYTIKVQHENTLRVDIDISGNSACNKMIFVCAEIRMFDLRCFDGENVFSPEAEDGILFIGETTKSISYSATLGAGGKHGYQGILLKDYGAFELCRAVALPHPTKYPDTETLPFDCSFTVCLPGKTEHFTTVLDSVYRVAKLRKRSIFYTSAAVTEGKVKLFMQRHDEKVVDRVMQTVSYFEELFGFGLPDFRLFLLNDESKPIFAGAGDDNAAFSIKSGNERDIELLAHRLFHAFFAQTKYAEEYFMPPYSFIEEGYASLYEILATKQNPKKSIFSIYKRYLFYYFAKPGFKLSPADEMNLQNAPWLIEFLHYTLSPLILHAFNQKFEIFPAVKRFDELEDAGLVNSSPLFLPEFEHGYDELEATSVAELNDYEYTISSWQGKREKTDLLQNIPPPQNSLEHKLYKISPSLYKMIQSAGGIL